VGIGMRLQQKHQVKKQRRKNAELYRRYLSDLDDRLKDLSVAQRDRASRVHPLHNPYDPDVTTTLADPAEVDFEVRLAEDVIPPGDEGETWIVGKNWIVELLRSSASTSEQRGMAEVLGGEIFVP
jgi:hypothetical protein